MPTELRVQGVTVRFGEVSALDAVDLTFETGALLGVMGPNGAGKSTLINVITGNVASTAGSIWLGDQRLDGRTPWDRQALGIARTFQRCELIGELSVEDNILVGAHRDLKFRDEILRRGSVIDARTKVEELAQLLALEESMLSRPVGTLPYGWQRRVEIARALMSDPLFLLLDEPVAGMDPDESAELGALVRGWVERTGHGVVLVEHDVDLVAQICDRVSVLDFGRLVATGTPEEVLSHPEVMKAYLGVEASV